MYRYMVYIVILILSQQCIYGQNSTYEILASADERIQKNRRGVINITLEYSNGLQLDPGKTVWIEQQKHEFLFGCNIFKFNKCRTPEQNTDYANRFSELFNFATLPFYWWGETENPNRTDKPWREEVIQWCKDNHIKMKGHTLAWNWKDPSWIPQDYDDAYNAQISRIQSIIQLYPEIEIWDVINEATTVDRPFPRKNAPILTEAILQKSVDQYLRDGFRVAHRASIQNIYLINDYKTGRKFKQDVLESLVVDGNALFDAIGIQTHMHSGYWGAKILLSLCEKFASFNRPIHFSEISILSGRSKNGSWEITSESEEKQAIQVREMVTLLFSNPNVDAITWWDFSDQGAWKNAPSGLLRADMTPKPAYHELKKLIKEEWWTSYSTQTNSMSEIDVHGFFGEYSVEVETDGQSFIGVFEIKKGHNEPIHVYLKPN